MHNGTDKGRISVLHVLSELCHSGAETMLRSLAPRLTSQGIDTAILATGPSVGPYAEPLRQAGCSVAHIPQFPFWRFAILYMSFLRSEGFDVVHLHQESAFFWTLLLSRLFTSRIIRTFHNSFFFEGWLQVKRRVMRLLAREVFRMIPLAPSTSVQAHEDIWFHNPCFLMPNGVDTALFSSPSSAEVAESRSQLGFGPNHVVVIMVGACTHVKRHCDVIEALAELKEEDSLHYVLLHIGTGKLEEEELRLSASFGLNDDVRFVGVVDDVRPYLAASDLFVMPSEYEGLGLSCAEAMAMQLPGVAAEVNGLRDLVIHEETGLLVTVGDVESIKKAIQRLGHDEKFRRRMGQAARDRIVKRYNIDRLAAQLSRMYAEVYTKPHVHS